MAKAPVVPATRDGRVRELRKQFLKELTGLKDGVPVNVQFREWARLAALCIASQTAKMAMDTVAHKEWEEKWERQAGSFGVERQRLLRWGGGLMAILTMGLEEQQGDFLGFVMEEIAATNKGTGQFFTPRSVAHFMAEMNFAGVDWEKVRGQGLVSIMDCACGAGVLLIEGVSGAMRHGVRLHDIYVEAQDIDVGAWSVCYLQLALLGIPAQVILGNALAMERRECAWTPAAVWFGTPGRWAREQRERARAERAKEAEVVA